MRSDGWYCPQCLTKANLSMLDGELQVEFTPEARKHSRWKPAGQEIHENAIRRGHERAAKGRDIVQTGYSRYGENEFVAELPETIPE